MPTGDGVSDILLIMTAVIKGLDIKLIYLCCKRRATDTDIKQKCNRLIEKIRINKQTGKIQKTVKSLSVS